jgi:hypothetical protein
MDGLFRSLTLFSVRGRANRQASFFGLMAGRQRGR